MASEPETDPAWIIDTARSALVMNKAQGQRFQTFEIIEGHVSEGGRVSIEVPLNAFPRGTSLHEIRSRMLVMGETGFQRLGIDFQLDRSHFMAFLEGARNEVVVPATLRLGDHEETGHVQLTGQTHANGALSLTSANLVSLGVGASQIAFEFALAPENPAMQMPDLFALVPEALPKMAVLRPKMRGTPAAEAAPALLAKRTSEPAKALPARVATSAKPAKPSASAPVRAASTDTSKEPAPEKQIVRITHTLRAETQRTPCAVDHPRVARRQTTSYFTIGSESGRAKGSGKGLLQELARGLRPCTN